jgi:hypothetical protein
MQEFIVNLPVAFCHLASLYLISINIAKMGTEAQANFS